jgi:hypothetical protein
MLFSAIPSNEREMDDIDIQFVAVKDLMDDDSLNIPISTIGTFKTAAKEQKNGNKQLELTSER